MANYSTLARLCAEASLLKLGYEREDIETFLRARDTIAPVIDDLISSKVTVPVEGWYSEYLRWYAKRRAEKVYGNEEIAPPAGYRERSTTG